MKFGGTSVEDAAAISRLVEIVGRRVDKKPLIVVSALSGVTSDLYRISSLAPAGEDSGVAEMIKVIKERHLTVLNELIPENSPSKEEACSQIVRLADQLEEIVKVVGILSELSERSLARIVSHGELLSSTLIWGVLKERGYSCKYLDARQFIVTNNNYLKADPIVDIIKTRVPEIISPLAEQYDLLITQGFISSTADGINTVLGRGGSDYSASLLGMALGVREIEIWTDVDGVHTADPRYVKGTRSISELSFEEAAEMAYFGAKVLHPSTILPAI
ncbi:MAG: aspartate kinase, partial [Bacteroidales bacterium]|nr:aspartate kinase [Bacteroidales bacterium]